MTLSIPFDNSYARLPQRFYTRMHPTPVPAPGLLKVNEDLARELGLDPNELADPEGLAILSGNVTPDGAAPLAQVYAGHQFGGWSPQLGDGRALLLGEVLDKEGNRRDIQLKGSGPTPYSRMGDGRAWLGPVIREYIVSEAMHALGIPTTRALAAVTTGEKIVRERALPGAVLTRVAASHIRVGTFQYFAARGDTEAIEVLTRHAITRHYPGAEGALGLLDAVTAAQANLVAKWMGVGFIHGVMNTDNTTISGETIDYGPCAFLDAYIPDKVFSSIDSFGRYAYGRQPQIMVWNLAQFATALLPLIDADQNTAIESATNSVNRFGTLFSSAWEHEFAAKLGLDSPEEEDANLAEDLMALMAADGADFTNAFRALGSPQARDQFSDRAAFDAWEARWHARTARDLGDREAIMRRANPAIIPRNHQVEKAINAAIDGDLAPFTRLVEALSFPFEDDPATLDLRRPPTGSEEVRQTFCGT
ncbi:MAG: YdiU family protein [Pseudomonadota bacterium]